MNNKTTPHILGTATNLLGFCLLVITSLHIGDKTRNSFIDEISSIIALLLTASCIFSFVSIRLPSVKAVNYLEKTADILFVIALVGIFFIILYLTLRLWNE
jgi:hypothetical protein